MFEELVGQEPVKRKLSFYLEAYEVTRTFPFLNFIGARGLGKSKFATEFSKYVIGSNGTKKPLLAINSSSIKSGKQFFDQVFLPHVNDQEVIVFFDECHALPKDFIYSLLTILSADKDGKIDYVAGDIVYSFDFKKHHFIFATTESQELFIPLRDRLTAIEFADYSEDDLKKIYLKTLPEIKFEDDALDILAQTSRGNARACVLRSNEIKIFHDRYCQGSFTKNNADKLFHILDILPYGLNRIEWQILNILRKNGSCSLSMLAAKTGLTRSAIQKDHELFLIRKGLINIDGLRHITNNGCKVLEMCKNSV
jgi:Holliday junction resolvasome RuvABC ATP-dependent DNA helicase subunit